MIPVAVVIILRKNQIHHLDQAIIYRRFAAFKGFPKAKVPAAYRKNNPIDGYGVALVLQPSQVDEDFGIPTLFLTTEHLEAIQQALDKSDELTAKLLNRQSWRGKRPYASQFLYHYM